MPTCASPDIVFRMAFDSGYEAGAEDAGSGELLVETLDLRYACYDLDGKIKRAIALDDLVMVLAVSVETLEHEEDCRCGLCPALEAVGVLPQFSLTPGTDTRAH